MTPEELDRLYANATERIGPKIWGSFAALMLLIDTTFTGIAFIIIGSNWSERILGAMVATSSLVGMHGWRLFFRTDIKLMRMEQQRLETRNDS